MKDLELLLPVTDNGDIDIEYMDSYIQTIKKLVIKGVVDWKDKELKAYNSAIHNVIM